MLSQISFWESMSTMLHIQHVAVQFTIKSERSRGSWRGIMICGLSGCENGHKIVILQYLWTLGGFNSRVGTSQVLRRRFALRRVAPRSLQTSYVFRNHIPMYSEPSYLIADHFSGVQVCVNDGRKGCPSSAMSPTAARQSSLDSNIIIHIQRKRNYTTMA